MEFPKCVPSKGRAGQSRTAEQLLAAGQCVHLFVEPQELETYGEAYPTAVLHDIGANDRGISFVRQFILEYARTRAWPWFWMLDDDVANTYRVVEKRCVRAPIHEVLDEAGRQISAQEGVAIGALEYQQFAWSAGKPYRFNSYCDVCVLINVERLTGVRYREEVAGKEDRDIVLQLLSRGHRSVRSSWHAFSTPKNGTNAGGLSAAYQSGKEAGWASSLVKLWPDLCQVQVKPDGRVDAKINWKAFALPTR